MTPTEKRVARGKEKKFKRKQRDRLEGAVDKFDKFKNGRKGAKGEKGAKEEALKGLVKEGRGVSAVSFFSFFLFFGFSCDLARFEEKETRSLEVRPSFGFSLTFLPFLPFPFLFPRSPSSARTPKSSTRRERGTSFRSPSPVPSSSSSL